MKKRIIEYYYDFLVSLENIFSKIEMRINKHRKNIDDKYWEKYLKGNKK